MKALIGWAVFALVLFGAAFGGAYFFQQHMKEKQSGQVEAIAIASLAALQKQGRTAPFVASFVAVVASGHDGAGASATRIMVMPALVRYEIDPGAIAKKNIKWDANTKTLSLVLPKLSVASPQVDVRAVRRYGQGGALLAAPSAQDPYDEENRRRAQADLVVQSGQESAMRLARDAARSAMERSFAMPLAASGIKATVKATFADEQGH